MTRTHGYATGTYRNFSPEYRVWMKMIFRCENRNYDRFDRYGGRGIKVCPEWRYDFPAFLAHIGPRPSPKHTIDRIDNDGDYAPGNVRWADKRLQNLNTHRKRTVTIDGQEMFLADAAILVGLEPNTVAARARRGFPVERWLEPARQWKNGPPRKKRVAA
jgi:hypothetical protein